MGTALNNTFMTYDFVSVHIYFFDKKNNEIHFFPIKVFITKRQATLIILMFIELIRDEIDIF